MTKGKIIMCEKVNRRNPGVYDVAFAAFAPKVPGMEIRVDVALDAGCRQPGEFGFQMAALAADARVTADERHGGVRVIECRLTPGRLLVADFTLSPVLPFVRINRIMAGIACRFQTYPLFINVAGFTLHVRVRADKGVFCQLVVDRYTLPIHRRMASTTMLSHLSPMRVLIRMAIHTLIGCGLQIGDTGSFHMACLAGHIKMGFLEWENGLLVIEVGTKTVDTIVASEAIHMENANVLQHAGRVILLVALLTCIDVELTHALRMARSAPGLA